MKGKAKKCEMRDISGTKPYPYTIPGPFFIAHVNRVVIAKIIKKTETRIEIVFSFKKTNKKFHYVNGCN